MEYQPLPIILVWFLLASANLYFAWFKPELFKKYLEWSSQVWGWSRSGKKWMASKYFFWWMRFGAVFIFVLSVIGLYGVIVETFSLTH